MGTRGVPEGCGCGGDCWAEAPRDDELVEESWPINVTLYGAAGTEVWRLGPLPPTGPKEDLRILNT